jgi:branched-chain amino acid transport system substrate-binding protein
VSRVYVSLPLTGPSGRVGREVLRGAELALERANRSGAALVALDGYGEDRDEQAFSNARRALEDPHALAYLGDFHSSQVLRTAPLLGEAGLLQVAPVATFVGLHGPTLVRLMPHDGVGARAIADWLVQAGVRDVLVVHDHDEGYGVPVAAMCVSAAHERGLVVRSRPLWDQGEQRAEDLGEAQAVVYVGVAGSGVVALWHDLHAANPVLWLLGTDGVAVQRLARELKLSAAERTRLFVPQRGPLGFYGFEAMALILDAIAMGGGDRAATVRAARTTQDRDSVIGPYSLDEDGHTTATAYGRLTVVGGELVWDLADGSPT